MIFTHRYTYILSIIVIFFSLVGCQSTLITNEGKEVTDKTIRTAAQAIYVVEMAAVTVANTLTAEYKAGRIKADVLQQFQSQIAPKVSAALATAKIALKTFQDAPERTSIESVINVVLTLQSELVTLQGFWLNALTITQGVRP